VGAGIDQDVSAVRSDPHPAAMPGRPVLVMDAGNSSTKLALVADGRLVRLGAFPSNGSSENEWEGMFHETLSRQHLRLQDMRRVAVSSVVPHVSDTLRAIGAHYQGITPFQFVAPDTAPITIDYQPPGDLGPDRIANAVAALERWGAPVVVVDVGTAITCDLVACHRRFAGGAIAPGPQASYHGLIDAAALLSSAANLVVDGDLPLAGTSTYDCLRVGLLRGTAALIDGLARSYNRIVGSCPVVATGGLASVITDFSDTITAVDVDLTLRGAYLSCNAASTSDRSSSTAMTV
jgi:type III pantothenate kinase